ncbi:MAG: hypothetical protein ABF913_06830 [Oenococcus sp.]|uniref:hypothetical protein n=1 Tax=Oenococcus sp. TaxID=1979414 RepID=UPI0039E850F8
MTERIMTWNGISSDNFNVFYAADAITFTKPERDVTQLEIPGRDGYVTIDNERLKPVTQNFNLVFLKKMSDSESVNDRINDITNWLFSTNGWSDLELDLLPNYVFRAMIQSGFDIIKTNALSGTFTVPFLLYPYKFLKSGQTSIPAVTSLTNPTDYPSSPVYTITGSGNGSLVINGVGMGFANVNGGLVIDIEKQTVMDLNGQPAYSTMTSEVFPVLKPGINTLAWTDGWTVQLIPKWKEVI